MGLTQDELAARMQLDGINVSRAAIANWEQGRNVPRVENICLIQSIARALRLSVREVLALSGYEVSVPVHGEAAQRAAFIVSQLPPEKQELAIGILERMME